ncbi:O-linked N-acetylglucosamine transferase, SPINDLY family protein [Pararhizobium sp.]|uniref:O-linked N-acetylglucosamine transferase, SPINDLY family protein n=1 Tax=Pararhizobium sp. TaxID=1977563 RepID=UPI00271F3779|nr:hypothetical protein [Pararhizobium sp.]MDO9418733.1 hypothetical protein [Pararhizobium sp.]
MSALFEKAKQQAGRGDHKIALATLRRLMEKERRHAEAPILAANIFEQTGEPEQAAEHYLKAAALSSTKKKELGFRAASLFLALPDPERALHALMLLHPFMPDDVHVVHGICSILREAGRYRDAEPFARTLAGLAVSFDNFMSAGIVLSGIGDFEAAYPLLQSAFAEKPADRLAQCELLWCAGNLCDFSLAAPLQEQLIRLYAAEGSEIDVRENAFRCLMWSDDEVLLARASLMTARSVLEGVPLGSPPQPRRIASDERIRVGYISSDFYDHATMALIGGVLEAHDRQRFEIYAFCHTDPDKRYGPVRARFEASVDHLVDIGALTDDQAAGTIRAAGIDILVDLKGFTEGARLGIFKRRPAAIQVSYLGFPGSVAGAGIDFALTDAVVTPETSAPFFEQTLLRLPDSYQCNDSKRAIPVRSGTRADHGLPDEGVVFCSFNHAVKIRPPVFAAWLEILKRVPGSVLWLGNLNPGARRNLTAAAVAAGVAAERLVFAPVLPMGTHLARLGHADIALDTAPCNGHTTTSDALWAGVPVVTMKGRSFAGRVSESLVRAGGLGDLVAEDGGDFIRLASAIASDPAALASLKARLVVARGSAPLFDTVRITRAIEAKFLDVYEASLNDAAA